jgi:SnoaL-like domain
MTREQVQAWLDAYVAAWRAYDGIAELFTQDATYRYHPYDDEAVEGRAAIVGEWLESQDAPGSWDARYEAYAADGDRAVGIGESRYLEADGSLRALFHNVFKLRFDGDGRCMEFVDYYMELPEELRAGR